jgi:hypothetical protein
MGHSNTTATARWRVIADFLFFAESIDSLTILSVLHIRGTVPK